MSSIIKETKVKVGKGREMKVMLESYDSAMDVVNDCRKRNITDSSFKDKSRERFGSWEGVRTYDEALEYLHNGYQPTVEKLRTAVKANLVGEGKRMSFKNNLVGYAPVVPLAMMGVPNCMIDMKMKPIKAKVIDVYYDITCSSRTDADDIIKNGQKLLGAIMSLESQGYRFNLYAVQAYSSSEDVDMLTVKLKSSNQPLDLRRISFPLTHTAFFRVIGFDWYSRTPKGVYRSGYGCALAHTLSKRQMDEFAHNLWGNNAVFIAGKEIMSRDEEYIKEVLLDGSSNNR